MQKQQILHFSEGYSSFLSFGGLGANMINSTNCSLVNRNEYMIINIMFSNNRRATNPSKELLAYYSTNSELLWWRWNYGNAKVIFCNIQHVLGIMQNKPETNCQICQKMHRHNSWLVQVQVSMSVLILWNKYCGVMWNNVELCSYFCLNMPRHNSWLGQVHVSMFVLMIIHVLCENVL